MPYITHVDAAGDKSIVRRLDVGDNEACPLAVLARPL